MHPVDMDKIASWPSEITTFLTAHSEELLYERKAEKNYIHLPSNIRITNGAPPKPRWNEATALIKNAMADRELIGFHATRFVDFHDVQKTGLMRLDLAQHVARVKRHLYSINAFEELEEIDAALAKKLEEDMFFMNHEGAVFATPHRASLHNGDCDVFFETYGGEALNHIASCACGKLKNRLKRIGEPAVVIFRYPAYSWCKFTHVRLPQSMIELHLQNQKYCEAIDFGWDITISQDVPAQNIIAVVPLDDPEIAV